MLDKKTSRLLHYRLKELRVKCDLTQSQVANALGINRSTYTYYETGRSEPGVVILGKLCAIYNVDFNDILSYESIPAEVHDGSNHESTEFTGHPLDGERLNMLSDDEKDIILKFRILSSAQKKEFLAAFGITETDTSKD